LRAACQGPARAAVDCHGARLPDSPELRALAQGETRDEAVENLLSLEDRILGVFTQKEVEATRTLFTQ